MRADPRYAIIPAMTGTPDIVALISASVPLKRRGALFAARCPFHEDKTDSFYVYPRPQKRAKPFFKCFGCGAHGDAVEWIKLTRKVSYPEACRILGTDSAAKPSPALIAERKARDNRDRSLNAYRDRSPDCCIPDWAIET